MSSSSSSTSTTTSTSSPPAAKSSTSPTTSIPPNKVGLSLLLVNGQRKEGWKADSKETVESFRKRVFEEWPAEWTSERPTSPKQLKFLHRGRFLELPQSFEQNKIPSGEVTVVHLIIMSMDGNDGSTDKLKSIDDSSSKCCCAVM